MNVLVIPHAVTGGGIGVTKSFQPNLRQCLPGKPPPGAEEPTVTQNGPAQRKQHQLTSSELLSTKKVYLISHLQQLGWSIKGNKCIGKDPPAICTLEIPSGMEKRKIPHPACSWGNGATSSSCQHCPVSPLSSPHRSRPVFHHQLPPCALSQRDELTSSISEFLR